MNLPVHVQLFAKPGGERLSTVGQAQPAAPGSAGQRFPSTPCPSTASAATLIYYHGAGLDPKKHFQFLGTNKRLKERKTEDC